MLGPTLEGPQVRIEPIDAELARAMLEGRAPEGRPWADGFPMTPVLDVLRKILAAPDGGLAFGPFLAYVIIRRSDGRAVGDAGFHGPPGPSGEVEVGYALTEGARGAGLATETVRLLSEWALRQPGVRAVTARVLPANARSIRVLERLGFARDGEHDGHLRFVLAP